jgi:hypothetical protein
VEVCEAVAEGLDPLDYGPEGWKESVTEIAGDLNRMAGSFYFKTMPSVPASRACHRDAEALKLLSDRGDWTDFPEGLAKLRESVMALAEKARMKGTTLT